MSIFNFNKIYVIESLDINTNQQTGKELFDDLFRWKVIEYNGKLKAELIQIENKNQFFDLLNRIHQECTSLHYKPILHIEMHGNKNGLQIQSGEFITWDELYDNLSKINLVVGNNLFLTLAVCYGAYLMSQIKLDKPAPFYGFIGSFNELYVADIMIRYNEFYKEFLSSFNFHNSIQKLFTANSDIPADYRFISSEDTFKDAYKNYLEEKFSKKGLKERIKDVIEREQMKFESRQLRRSYEREFEKLLKQTKDKYYKEHMLTFFMVKEFPNNLKRFKLLSHQE